MPFEPQPEAHTSTEHLNQQAPPPKALLFACAVACGIMVANLYYAQPLIALIAPELQFANGKGGLIVTATQLGYAMGLLLIVPLADFMENRRLILLTLAVAAGALVVLAISSSAALFLVTAVAVGCFSAGAQVIVPLAASLAPEASRGRTIGQVMAGLLTGIMLARPFASLIADFAGWRAVFWVSAVLMLLLAIWLRSALPIRSPAGNESYGRILGSMFNILRTEPRLQRRAIYQGLCFAIFNLFWTASPLVLAQRFGWSQKAIALFALAGAGGALAAPLAGRLGDRGHIRLGTGVALATICLSAIFSQYAVQLGSIGLLVLLAIALDAATQINQVLGQRVIYSLSREARGRINAIYMTIVFVIGATGSVIATASYHYGGWLAAMLCAAALGALNFAYFLTERRMSGASAMAQGQTS